MIVNIIKKAEEVVLNDDITSYHFYQPIDKEGRHTINPLYGIRPINDENYRHYEYPIHKIRWTNKIHNYVFQDKVLEKMIEDYNTEWELMNNKIFELQKINADWRIKNNLLKNMGFFQFLKMKFDKKFKRSK